MTTWNRVAILGAIAWIGAATAQAASVQSFTSRTAFEAALGALVVEDFDDLFADNGAITIPQNTETDLGPFSVQHSSNQSGFFAPKVVDASGPYEVNAGSASPYLQLRGEGDPVLTFDTPLFGFGANFNSISDVGLTLAVHGSSFTLFDELGPAPTSFAEPNQNGGFFGVVATDLFSTLAFSSPRPETFAFDDVALAPVPVPAPFALLAAGLALMGGVARRRSA